MTGAARPAYLRLGPPGDGGRGARARPRERSFAAMATQRALLASVLCAAALATTPAAGAPAAALARGAGSFDFDFAGGQAQRTIRVWYHVPERVSARSRIVFVIHGEGRNATGYRRVWTPIAEEQGFVLLVPEFSRSEFSAPSSYSLGSMIAADGARLPEAEWTFTAIERLFDSVRAANAFEQPAYDIYGHSAGGQFVHRLVLFKPDARYRIAIAANAGWYAMPDFAVAFPYGLQGSGADEAVLRQALSRRLHILLGDADIDPAHPQLRRSPEALAQGRHRFARGHAFFEQAHKAASRLGVPLSWRLELAPGVAHSNAAIAPYAARLLAD